MRKAITTVVAGACLALSSQPLMAVGFGRLVNATTLGQSLDVSVPLSADITDQITSECVGAVVVVGDSVLPHPAVRVRLESPTGNGTRLLRVTTTVRVHEPIVNVTVSVACPSRVSRQFVVFVDPPMPAFESGVPVAPEPPAVASAPGASAAEAALPVPDPVIAREDAAAASSTARASPPEPAATRTTSRASTAKATKAAAKASVARRAQAAARKARRASSAEARARAVPRLELERGTGAALATPVAVAASAAVEPSVSMSVASAASAAVATDAETAARAQRDAIQSLQQRLDKLQVESEASRKSVAQLEARLREAEAPRSGGWLAYALMALGAALLLWIGLLIGRRASASRPGATWWNAEADPAPAASRTPAPPAFVASTMSRLPEAVELSDDTPTTDPIPLVITEPPPPDDTPRASPGPGDTVASVGTASTATPASASRLTADELIDLDQQAEFFVALGQDDSAVDLLNACLRGHGGASPLPYLKLLEIHRRRGEREAHERIRERHERRFGASARGWDDESATPLESHAALFQQIESVWADPARAMRLIESVLVSGGPSAASFDLLTFGDLQFLYQLARCVAESDEPSPATVDLLLPLSHQDEPRSVLAASRSTASAIDLELDFAPSAVAPKPTD